MYNMVTKKLLYWTVPSLFSIFLLLQKFKYYKNSLCIFLFEYKCNRVLVHFNSQTIISRFPTASTKKPRHIYIPVYVCIAAGNLLADASRCSHYVVWKSYYVLFKIAKTANINTVYVRVSPTYFLHSHLLFTTPCFGFDKDSILYLCVLLLRSLLSLDHQYEPEIELIRTFYVNLLHSKKKIGCL